MSATVSFTPPLFKDSTVFTTVKEMADAVALSTNNVMTAAKATDFSDPGSVVLLQMRVNQVTNAATAVSNLVKAMQEPSKNAVSNLR
jgi:hypothetical protein